MGTTAIPEVPDSEAAELDPRKKTCRNSTTSAESDRHKDTAFPAQVKGHISRLVLAEPDWRIREEARLSCAAVSTRQLYYCDLPGRTCPL